MAVSVGGVRQAANMARRAMVKAPPATSSSWAVEE
jgi:hypothetical protein